MKHWVDVSWPEIEGCRGEAIAVLVSGAVEQHGPHLPLATDVYIPTGIVESAVSKLEARDAVFASRFFLLPQIFYSYAKESDIWPGTLNLDGGTLTGVIRDVLKNLFRQGVRNAILVNGHMESLGFVFEGIGLAVEGRRDVRVMNVNWWDYVPDALIDEVFGDRWPGWVAEHAALTETSMMLHFRPDLVRLDRMDHGDIPAARPYKLFPQLPEMLPASGMYAPAVGASAETGALIANRIAEGVANSILEAFSD